MTVVYVNTSLSCIDDPNTRLGKMYAELKELYQIGGCNINYYDYYNRIERLVLNIQSDNEAHEQQKGIDAITHIIKQLSIELQRSKPTEWNSFLDVLLGSQ